MTYNFNKIINRKGTGSHKWNQMYESNNNIDEDVLPLSVADMELHNPPQVYEGLINFMKNEPVLGYTGARDEFLQAVVDWQAKRHNWNINKEWIINTSGVVSAFNAAIRTFTNKGDGVIIFRPVYHPFTTAINNNDRKEVNVPLIEKDGNYTIDFEGFQEAASRVENKVLLFCSPHNPVGRVWTRSELEQLAEIAVKHKLYVISDEIWYDFVHPDKKHTILYKINDDLQSRLITCTASSKTFNLAGLETSNIIISDDKLRKEYALEVMKSNYSGGNIFGFEANRIVYNECEEWLEQVIELVYSNQEMVRMFFQENYPKIKAPISEGTYLQWLDFRELDMDDRKRKVFLHENQFFTSGGNMFGPEGSGFERINVALPQSALSLLLDKLLKALQKRDMKD